jgi:hypothetical protein
MAKTRSGLLFGLALLYALLATGCSGGADPVPYAREYPNSIERAPATLNIQVFKRPTRLEFTNTTPRAYAPATIWLNRRFSYPIDSIAIGESISLPLSNFRDEFSDAFRGGGFFAREAPERLVLAEIETPGPDGKPLMLGMVVVLDQDQ